jgi:hypothetical protein
MTVEHDRADEIYSTLSLLEAAGDRGPTLSVRQLVHFLTLRGSELSPDQTRAIFANPKLREAYRMIKAQLAVWEMPAAVAASDGKIVQRNFAGGTLRLTPSQRTSQTYLAIRYDSATEPHEGHDLVVETHWGEILKLNLPRPDEEREVLIVLDAKNARDEAIINALQDPRSTGAFLSVQAPT